MPASKTPFLSAFRATWLLLPKSFRYRLWKLAGPTWQLLYAKHMLARPRTQLSFETTAPLVVAGLFSTANGIGEAARATYRSLQEAGLNPIAVDLSEYLAPVDVKSKVKCQPMPDDAEGTLILQLNAPETMAALQHLNMNRGRNWYTIGYWAWELPNFPKGWERAFPMLSEVWAISEFTASAIEQHKKAKRVSVFPHAISSPKQIANARSQYGWSDDQFVFLAMADGMSSLTRKNPFAVIESFKAAFGDDPNRRLIIKTRNLSHKPAAQADLIQSIGTAKNIEILDESLSDADRWALLNAVDCFVSLHRSEGFGLVLAEAMALGKPVLCTNWSGNTDFTTAETAALVDYKLISCEDPYGIYTDTTSHWAEVDLDDAMAKMKRIAADEDYRIQIGAAAKKHIETWASAERIGELMAKRLSEIPTQ